MTPARRRSRRQSLRILSFGVRFPVIFRIVSRFFSDSEERPAPERYCNILRKAGQLYLMVDLTGDLIVGPDKRQNLLLQEINIFFNTFPLVFSRLFLQGLIPEVFRNLFSVHYSPGDCPRPLYIVHVIASSPKGDPRKIKGAENIYHFFKSVCRKIQVRYGVACEGVNAELGYENIRPECLQKNRNYLLKSH